MTIGSTGLVAILFLLLVVYKVGKAHGSGDWHGE